jgi:hypothetical protein
MTSAGSRRAVFFEHDIFSKKEHQQTITNNISNSTKTKTKTTSQEECIVATRHCCS